MFLLSQLSYCWISYQFSCTHFYCKFFFTFDEESCLIRLFLGPMTRTICINFYDFTMNDYEKLEFFLHWKDFKLQGSWFHIRYELWSEVYNLDIDFSFSMLVIPLYLKMKTLEYSMKIYQIWKHLFLVWVLIPYIHM